MRPPLLQFTIQTEDYPDGVCYAELRPNIYVKIHRPKPDTIIHDEIDKTEFASALSSILLINGELVLKMLELD